MLITERPIDLSQFAAEAPPEDCGGSAFFVGRVRDHHEGRKVRKLFYECYLPMAEKEIVKIMETVKSETGVRQVKVVHRIGWLEVGDIAIAISASGAHRQEAFWACRELIDRIKETVPIWKKEIYEDATQSWVVCRHSASTPESRVMPEKYFKTASNRGRIQS